MIPNGHGPVFLFLVWVGGSRYHRNRRWKVPTSSIVLFLQFSMWLLLLLFSLWLGSHQGSSFLAVLNRARSSLALKKNSGRSLGDLLDAPAATAAFVVLVAVVFVVVTVVWSVVGRQLEQQSTLFLFQSPGCLFRNTTLSRLCSLGRASST